MLLKTVMKLRGLELNSVQDISVFYDISVLLRTSRKIFPQRVATGLRSHKNDFWNNIRAFCCRRKTVLKLPLLQIKDFK